MFLILLVYGAKAIISSQLDCDLQSFGGVNDGVHLT